MTMITVIQFGGDYFRDDYFTVIKFGAHDVFATPLTICSDNYTEPGPPVFCSGPPVFVVAHAR